MVIYRDKNIFTVSNIVSRAQPDSNILMNEFSNVNSGILAKPVVSTYSNTVTAQCASNAYSGAVYSPLNNFIFFIPQNQASSSAPSAPNPVWHYINCSTGAIAGYTATGTGIANGGYIGGALDPFNNRIYMAPSGTGTIAAGNWYYIDCTSLSAVSYAAPVITGTYSGAVYSPIQKRIYFVPRSISNQASWHYVNCVTGAVVAYTNNSGVTPVTDGYTGGVYSPELNRIYFIPRAQSDQTYWHYIDCNTGDVVAYLNNSGVTPVSGGYLGGVYSPLTKRIHFVPRAQGAVGTFHYIDSTNGSIGTYTNNSGVAITSTAPFSSGVYSPCDNRIYFIPYNTGPEANWYYLDCNTGNMVAYTYTVTAPVSTTSYFGGCFSTTQNRVYLAPASTQSSAEVIWHYIGLVGGNNVSAGIMAGPVFNKF